MTLAFSACSTLAESPLQDGPPATATTAPPSPTIVWFPPSATPTAQSVSNTQPTPEQKPDMGSLLLTDDFLSAEPWNPVVSDEASVSVSHNRLTIAVQPGVSAARVRQGSTLTDFYAEITARPSLCRDADEYGLLFRAPNNVAFYAFVASCNGTALVERVRFDRVYPLRPAMPSADVPAGAPGEVRLGVWASGSSMRFFLNGHYQFSVDDRSYAAGSVGVFARSVGDTPVAVTFSDLSVYTVSALAPSSTPNP